MPKYLVDISTCDSVCYVIEAANEEQACELANERHEEGVEPDRCGRIERETTVVQTLKG